MKCRRSNNLFLACQHLGRLSLARECDCFRSLLAMCPGDGGLPATQKAPEHDLIAGRLLRIVFRRFRVATRTNVRGLYDWPFWFCHGFRFSRGTPLLRAGFLY